MAKVTKAEQIKATRAIQAEGVKMANKTSKAGQAGYKVRLTPEEQARAVERLKGDQRAPAGFGTAFTAGIEVGKHWAVNVATVRDLKGLAEDYLRHSDGQPAYFQMWADATGYGEPLGYPGTLGVEDPDLIGVVGHEEALEEIARGFVLGARAVWVLVKDEVYKQY
jgi:hypothetical protein